MEFWQYFIIAIVSFLGLITGLIVAFVAKEEIKAGKTYFEWLKRVLLVVITALVFVYYELYIYGIIAVIIVCAWLYFFRKKNLSFAEYALLGILLAASSKSAGLLAAASILAMFFSHAEAALFVHNKKQGKIPAWKEFPGFAKTLLVCRMHFLVFAIALFFAF